MIATAIILGVTAALIATIAVFWRNIVEWMKKAIKKLQDVLGIAIEGSKTFIKRTTDKIQNFGIIFIGKLTNRLKYYFCCFFVSC